MSYGAVREFAEAARAEVASLERASLALHDPQALELIVIASLALQHLDERLDEIEAGDADLEEAEGVAVL